MELQSNFKFLSDETFLIKLVEQQEHDIYARITALNNDNDPVDQIEGKITGGSISIDGNSAIRRTCNLTLINNNINFNDFYWGIKTKFKLEIGLYNYLKGEYSSQNGYPEIMWFSQGYYIISTFNSSLSTSNYTISISGKDKMSLLNGELSGSLPSSINFGVEETLIETVEPVTSDRELLTVLNGSYYVISKKNYINKNDFRGQKIEDDAIFIYIEDNNGRFHTENEVIFLKADTNNPANYQIYELAKSIKDINQLFEEAKNLNSNTYKQNKYYYKNNLNEYVLDTNKIMSSNRQYYTLVKIYQKKINMTIEKNPIEKIIREAVHTYAQEPYQNIIINDLDNQGLEKLTFKGEKAYIVYEKNSYTVYQFILSNQSRPFENCIKQSGFQFYEPLDSINNATPIYIGEHGFTTVPPEIGSTEYVVRKIYYGEDVGYRLTPLTYAGDLIANAGETFTSVLDKIKTMLGEFEYFYNLEGKFVFQKKKNYLQTSWNQLSITNDKMNQENNFIDFNKHKMSYNFINNYLVSNISNSPSLINVRNDFTVWGKRKGISGQDIPIHARYAIDKKPVYYKTLSNQIFYNIQEQKKSLLNNSKINKVLYNPNWWNLKKFITFLENFNIEIDKSKAASTLIPITGVNATQLQKNFPTISYIENENTNNNDIRFIQIKFEDNKYQMRPSTNNGNNSISWYCNQETVAQDPSSYYLYIPSTILINFVDWREIIYQMALDYFAGQGCSKEKPVYLGEKGKYLTNSDNLLYEVGKRNPEYYPTGYTNYEQYYTDLQGFWRQLYNPFYQTSDFYTMEENSNRCFWNKNIYESPESLNFWFDFLNSEEDTDLINFSIPEIGDRNIVVKEDKASSIVFNEVPDMILYDNESVANEKKEIFSGQTFIKVPSWYSQYFNISSKTLSVKDKIDELLYQRTYCTENITITSIPIYYLQPNTRILVKDDKTGINGEYIVHKLTIPLTYNGTMSISASKAPERLY